MTDCWLSESEEPQFLEQCQMYITAPNTYATAKERNEDYKNFLADLAKCESHAAIRACKADYLDMFSKLRNEKDEGFYYHGFDYLDELHTAIENQKTLIGE